MGATSLIILAIFAVIRLIQYFSSNSGYERYDPTPLPPKPRSAEEAEIPTGDPFYSNAPEHWGTITNGFLAVSQRAGENFDHEKGGYAEQRRIWMLNSLMLCGAVNKALSQIAGEKIHISYGDAMLASNERYATSCCIEKLFVKGVISINGIIIDDYKRYGILLCEAPTPMKYIDELRKCFIEDGYTDLIYFALHDPTLVDTAVPLKFENFNANCFTFDQEKQSHHNWTYDKYAMWWASETEPTFNSAVIKDDMRLHLDLLNFHNSYALGVLSYAFGLKNDNDRVKLPDDSGVVIVGPEGVEMIMTLSTQQGINFHFPMLPQFERYRNTFIKVYTNFCYQIRAQILEHDLPDDSSHTPSTLAWYEQLLNQSTEVQNDIESIGCLTKSEL